MILLFCLWNFGGALGFLKPRLRMAISDGPAELFGHLSNNFPQYESLGNNRRDSTLDSVLILVGCGEWATGVWRKRAELWLCPFCMFPALNLNRHFPGHLDSGFSCQAPKPCSPFRTPDSQRVSDCWNKDYFSASLTDKCGHRTNFWPIGQDVNGRVTWQLLRMLLRPLIPLTLFLPPWKWGRVP